MNKEETIIMKNRPILSRVILYSAFAIIVSVIMYFVLYDPGEAERKRWQGIKYLGHFLYYTYKEKGKLPSQKSYLKHFKNNLLDKDYYKRNKIYYKYSPEGWTAPDGRKYRVLIWDKKEQILYKVEVNEDNLEAGKSESDCIIFWVDTEPYFPEWSKTQ
jgi:hypothetical protein